MSITPGVPFHLFMFFFQDESEMGHCHGALTIPGFNRHVTVEEISEIFQVNLHIKLHDYLVLKFRSVCIS